jgi:hypothetical protein
MNEIDNQYSYTHPDPVPAGSSAAFDVTLDHIHFANVIPKYFKLGSCYHSYYIHFLFLSGSLQLIAETIEYNST